MADSVWVLTEHEPSSEYQFVVIGVYETKELAEAAELERRADPTNASKDAWPECDEEWEIEWSIEEHDIKRAVALGLS